MGLTDLLKNAGRVFTLTAALYSCGGEEKEGCQTDYDCREPRVCVRGYCEGTGDNNYSGNGENGSSSGDFCQEYIEDMCPGTTDTSVEECRDYCNESSSPRDQPDADCAFIACAVIVGTCDTYMKADPRDIIDCMREYGWGG